MVPVFWTVKENGAVPAAELMIVGAVYVRDFPSGESEARGWRRSETLALERADVDVLFGRGPGR